MSKYNNFEFVAIDPNGYDLGSFANDEMVMKHLISMRGREIFPFASQELQTNKDFVLFSIKRDPNIWYDLCMYATDECNYMFDKDIVLAVINHYDFIPMVYNDYNNDFYKTILSDKKTADDVDILAALAKVNPEAFDKIGFNIVSNRKMILDLISKYGCFLKYASSEVKDDTEIVVEAISNDIHAFKYASARLRFDKKIVSYALNLLVYKLCDSEIDIQEELNEIVSYTNKECNKYIEDYIKNNLNNDICFVKTKINKEG